jgi:hypothetical protein
LPIIAFLAVGQALDPGIAEWAGKSMAVDFSPLVRFENFINLNKRHGEAAEESR